jgi:transcriptional regulator with XRE-family HTH domain
MRETFIANLRKLRKLADITQNDLADRVKVSHRSYQSYESGEVFPPPETIEDIARALNCQLGELFGLGKEDDQISPAVAAELVDPILKHAGLSVRKERLILALLLSDPSYLTGLSEAQLSHAKALLKAL